MIDSALAFVASTGTQSAPANSSSVGPSRNGREKPGFAEALAQSTEHAGAKGESAPAREHASVAPDHDPEKVNDGETSRGDAADGANLAALLALVAPDSQRANPQVGGKHAVDASAITLDAPSANAAPAGASLSGPAARRAVKAIAIDAGEDPALAGLVAQSPESAGAGEQTAATRGLSALVPGPTPVPEGQADTTRANAADDIDPLLALVTAKSLAEGLPAGGKPGVDAAGSQRDKPSASAAPAGATSSESAARGTARAFAIGDPGNAPPGLIPATAEGSAPGQATATIQPAGIERKTERVQAADSATRDAAHEPLAAGNTSNPVSRQAKSPEFGDGSALQKTDELGQTAAHQAETAPVPNIVTGSAANAAGAHSMTSTGPAAAVLVPTHVESPAWSKDFCQQVIRLAVAGQPAAEIHLNPPDWGPIRVSVEIKGQDATLQFSAAHPQTREALEAALPRLHEMFAADSLNLAGANVSGQSSSQHFSGAQRQHFNPPPAGANNGRALATDDAAPAAIAVRRPTAGRSRVDLFA